MGGAEPPMLEAKETHVPPIPRPIGKSIPVTRYEFLMVWTKLAGRAIVSP
jgi:hypothetical protein